MRLKAYDYRSAGAYFVTFCTDRKRHLLGRIADGQSELNEFGLAVESQWNGLAERFDGVLLDSFVVMPNHVHGLIVLQDNVGSGLNPTLQRPSLPKVMWALKTFSARDINELRGTPKATVWQPKYYEHIVRSEDALSRIRDYIANNPAKWAEDRFYA